MKEKSPNNTPESNRVVTWSKDITHSIWTHMVGIENLGCIVHLCSIPCVVTIWPQMQVTIHDVNKCINFYINTLSLMRNQCLPIGPTKYFCP